MLSWRPSWQLPGSSQRRGMLSMLSWQLSWRPRSAPAPRLPRRVTGKQRWGAPEPGNFASDKLSGSIVYWMHAHACYSCTDITMIGPIIS